MVASGRHLAQEPVTFLLCVCVPRRARLLARARDAGALLLVPTWRRSSPTIAAVLAWPTEEPA
jgi:hypothetical protein